MTKYKRQRTLRPPSHPGEILKNVWLEELSLSQSELAQLLADATKGAVKKNTMQTKLSEIINGKRGMSAEFAVLLGRVLKTSPRMWMSLQVNRDIWEAEQEAA
jgi:addiction module HigA family antidote